MDRGDDRSSEKDGALMIVSPDGMLILGYILPRQGPVHNPYYSALYFMFVQ